MSEDIHEAAAHWYAAQDHDDMDWDAFTAWLEADPGHRIAFDEIALLDERIDARRATLQILLAPAAPMPKALERRRLLGWGVVAAVILVGAGVGIGINQSQNVASRSSVFDYRAGNMARDLALGNGVRASLAPGSELAFSRNAPTKLTLTGRAIFEVVHDEGRPLIVSAQGYKIRDVGTRFEVLSDAGLVKVSVAEGRVAIQSPASQTETIVPAGRSLTGFADGDIQIGVVRRESIGGWLHGSLVYNNVPLGLVVADIARETGKSIVADPAIERQSFSGVLATGDADSMVRSLEALANLRVRRDGDTFRLGNSVRR